ncbi:MAG: SGNH/GDSL hydrolase family protein [Treponema sp.]|nr:SGNH/GDSL hydrolase family protein [Treponema sp.]
MKKNKLFWGSVILASAILFASCASNSQESSSTVAESEKPAEPVVKSNHPFGIEESEYAKLMNLSLVSKGNNARIKKVLEKLRAGQDVYIAALGGSVTEGAGPSNYKDGYAYQFNKKLKEKYTPDNGAHVFFNGAGLSGTPSQLGLVRYQSDVVDVLGHIPDILIIEFAVNDEGGDNATRPFEALVRNALIANPETLVIALYSAAQYGNTANPKKVVAEWYQIPQINVLDVVKTGVAKKFFTEQLYYTDNVHPTKNGHEIQADTIINLFDVADADPADQAVEVPADWCRPKPLTNFTRILGDDDNVKITKGSFSSTDTSTQGIKKTGKGNFPQNWYHESGDESFKMEITCKALIFTYKEQGSWLTKKFGKAEVYVDGKLKATYDGGKAGGWCNCVPVYLIDEAEAAKHTVEVKMLSGDESKGFTIVAMGYSK